MPTRLRVAWLAPALALAVAACGSSGPSGRLDLRTPPGPAPRTTADGAALTAKEPITRMEERVIRRWASTLRHGHVARAARYFALPAEVSNGFDPVRISTRAQARAFNRILSCGAIVVALERQKHHLVAVTFRLVTRTGAGAESCDGGGTARAAFRVRRGHITKWLRLPDAPTGGAPPSTAS
jgi:hypothetical protein